MYASVDPTFAPRISPRLVLGDFMQSIGIALGYRLTF